MSSGHVVALLRSNEDRASVVTGGLPVRFFGDGARLASAASDLGVRGVILDVGRERTPEIDEVVGAVVGRPVQVPLLLRVTLPDGVHSLKCAVPCEVHDLTISLRGYDRLSDDLARIASGAEHASARQTLVTRLVPTVRDDLLDIVVAAIAASADGVSVARLARLCASSSRRLQERLAVHSNIGPKRLIMELLVLHSLWRLRCLGWTRKRAAAAAGCSSYALAKRIERTTGHRLSVVLANRSFREQLSEVVANLDLFEDVRVNTGQDSNSRDSRACPGPRIEANGRAFR
jgi:AraC-like DNA-binding protein